MKILTHIFFSVIVIALVGCNSSTASLDMVNVLPVYREAFNIDKRGLGGESNQQLSYQINKAYPSIEVLALYDEYFIEHGWKKCTGNIEKWQSFIDAANGSEQLVHQLAHYFVKEGERKISTVFIQYRSDLSEVKTGPDSEIQNIFILVQRGIDIKKELQRLSISC